MGDPIRDPDVLERMRTAFDLYRAAEDMMRLNLRRRYPEATDAEIEKHLAAWLQDRPGAEIGDAEGRPVPWPRRKR